MNYIYNSLSGARIAFIGIKDVRKSATIQTAFVFTMDGASQIGFVLTGKGEQTMPDRKKVIKEFEAFVNGHCPSDFKHVCHIELMATVLELLKEQEAVVPKKGKIPEESAFDCGNCGYPLWEDELYCAHCGRAVKWDG